ncbi:Uncharacterised protein [Vibrio cholerae]|nr:Uncharacterised protein [Vibrio cholerae]
MWKRFAATQYSANSALRGSLRGRQAMCSLYN